MAVATSCRTANIHTPPPTGKLLQTLKWANKSIIWLCGAWPHGELRNCKLGLANCNSEHCVSTRFVSPKKNGFTDWHKKNVPRLTAWNVSYVCWCVWLRPVLLQQLPRQLQEPLRPLPSLLRLRPRWQRLRERIRQPSCCGGCDA